MLANLIYCFNLLVFLLCSDTHKGETAISRRSKLNIYSFIANIQKFQFISVFILAALYLGFHPTEDVALCSCLSLSMSVFPFKSME